MDSTTQIRSATAAAAEADSPFGQPSVAVRSGWQSLDRALQAVERSSCAALEGTLSGLDSVRSNDMSPVQQERGGGLVRGGVHEWFGVGAADNSGPDAPLPGDETNGTDWTPPLLLLAHLARRAVDDAVERGAPSNVLWIGRQVWPYPRVLGGGVELVETPSSASPQTCGMLELNLRLRETPEAFSPGGSTLFERSLFVDPGRGRSQNDSQGSSPGSSGGPTRGRRGATRSNESGLALWAIDTALRCPSVTAIVADGSGLDMAATRRLQLAAAAAGALILLARPPHEVGHISAATTRWIVTRGDRDGPPGLAYRARLLRAKGSQRVRSAG